jgi:hypothetical protein
MNNTERGEENPIPTPLPCLDPATDQSKQKANLSILGFIDFLVQGFKEKEAARPLGRATPHGSSIRGQQKPDHRPLILGKKFKKGKAHNFSKLMCRSCHGPCVLRFC